jgi:hypothetical protein
MNVEGLLLDHLSDVSNPLMHGAIKFQAGPLEPTAVPLESQAPRWCCEEASSLLTASGSSSIVPGDCLFAASDAIVIGVIAVIRLAGSRGALWQELSSAKGMQETRRTHVFAMTPRPGLNQKSF